MKVLLREYSGKQYVWVDAERDNENRFVVNDTYINETKIVSVSGIEENNIVKCSSCGALIPNNSRAIKKHREVSCDWHNCLKCKYLREESSKNEKRNYVRNEDGTFSLTKRANVILICGASYYRRNNIITDAARNSCGFKRCKNATMIKPDDFFFSNPGVFDDIITIDKIIDNGYVETWNNGGYSLYRLKAKNKIIAYVNKLNVVDHFRIEYRNDFADVVYSKKLNKLFSISNGVYSETISIWNMPSESLERIKNKIASLYN